MNNPFQSYNRGYTARERRIRTKYASLFLVTGLACIWLSVKSYDDSKELEGQRGINTQLQTQTVKMQNQIDSLHDEAFNASTINGRYELSLDYLKEVNPKAAKQFEDYMNTQTE